MVKSINIRPTVIGISSCTYYLVYTSVEEKVFNLISRGSPVRLFEVKEKNNHLEKLGCCTVNTQVNFYCGVLSQESMFVNVESNKHQLLIRLLSAVTCCLSATDCRR